jgi:predicted dienelactone hydrolase
MYSLPGGEVGISVAQSNGSATVVLLVTADSLNDVAPVNSDVLAILNSVSIEGVSASSSDPGVTSTPVPQAQGEIPFPELTGPHAVGRTSYLWTDDSREELFTPEEGDPRVLTVWVWYPAAPGTDAATAPYLTDGMSELFQQLFGVGSNNVHAHAYDAAPVLDTETGYPVLVYSPGTGHNAVFATSLLEEVASHGYVVVGIDHTYNAMLTTLADGQVVNGTPTQTDTDFTTRIADFEFVIDQLAEVNSSDDLLKGNLDLAHLGVYGHSFGGTTAAEVCRMDARCQATIVIDWGLQGEVAEVGLSKPIMLMDSERISVEQYAQEAEELTGQTIPEGVSDLIQNLNDARDTTAAMLLDMSPDAYRVIVDGTRHYSFTDILLLAKIQPALYAATGAIATIDAERAQRVVSDYVVAFFDTYLKGDSSPLLESASADYAEVTLIRHAE